jgi:hypothetical protein
MRIFDKHVNIPRKPLPRILSMDEHYFPASDFDSLYCCLLMDFETGELVDILPDRKKSYLIVVRHINLGSIRHFKLVENNIKQFTQHINLCFFCALF